jgi:microcystin-dependent protein
MYNSTYNNTAGSETANLTFEVNGSNGAMRIGNGANVQADTTAGSLTLGSHIVLNNDSNVTPNTSTRPTGRKGLIRFNDDTNSAEIYDGSVWADVGYYAGLPLGAIIAYPSDTAPNDTFLLCNGGSLSRSTYQDLFNLFNVNNSLLYGSADSNSFYLPNIQGRTIVGKGGGTFTALNQTGGVENVTLDINQIPVHRHNIPEVTVAGSGKIQSQFQGIATDTQQAGGHTHAIQQQAHYHGIDARTNTGWITPGGNQYLAHQGQWGSGGGNANITIVSDGVHTHQFTPSGTITSTLQLGTFQTQSTETTDKGGSGSHTNLQPFIVLNYFIKAKKESKRYSSTPLVSDARVKQNIQDMDSNEALNAILSLKPKRYEYLDQNISEFKKHIGFVAQEIKQYIPECVQTKREFVPNVYSMAKITVKVETNSILLTSVQKPITTILIAELKNQHIKENKHCQDYTVKDIKLRIFNRAKQPICIKCNEAIDEYNILIESCNNQNVLKNDEYFVYGQEIDDYHYMNNDAIFSTLVSAFQSLVKKVENQEILISKLCKK